jgi:hypothetical protein
VLMSIRAEDGVAVGAAVDDDGAALLAGGFGAVLGAAV